MREFVILGSSIVNPPNPHHHNHHIKPFNTTKSSSSLPKFTPSSKQSSPSSSSSLLSTVSISHTNQIPVKHYAHLASKLAEDGKFQDFEMIVQCVIDSGVNASQFAPALSTELLAKGILVGIRAGRVRDVIETFNKVLDLGISLSGQFDGSAMESLAEKCCQMVMLGQIQEAVELMEVASYLSEN